ncbi:Uncharacterized membrane protein [Pseudooceanicola antarcticus]|uniref:DUF599 domain-containing protein n=1 Tax=Pseudooceanicola antarcticus TaxID=1247613 RepID=A0A285HMX9_9RHOB|nr:DUF599 domain-containing protein [Pseudooceanicola antarcticus]PJE27789.1 DUF599 domain-containing protein [Pseudooceanicola antarcticus]SNY37047.1 Uncharacterized membrane protein [Pseudooceanicola antarcticus]
MILRDYLSLFTLIDALGVVVILASWLLIGWRIEHPGKAKPSVSILMGEYRREWLRKMTERSPRIFDAQILGTLRANVSFFASSTMIAIGGALALLGNSDQLRGIASDLGAERSPAVYWEIKLFLVLLFLANAFLKFVWSSRLFGYCGVLMGAVPNEASDPKAIPRALKAAQINIFAARSFNRGLRSIYFSLAAACWFAGPWGLLAGTVVTCAMLWRREFASQSRELLMQVEED